MRPERHLGLVGARTVGDRPAELDPVALGDGRALVDAGALVGAAELGQPVGLVVTVVLHDLDVVGRDLGDDTGGLGHDDVAGVDRGAVLHAGADERRLGTDQRHGLTLHVGAHQRAVGVVVLEERDQRGRDRHHLARRDVHVVDVAAGHVVDLAAAGAHEHAVLLEGVLRR